MPKIIEAIVTANTTDFQQKMNKVEGTMSAFGSTMTGIGTSMTLGLTVPLTTLGVTSSNAATDFEAAMNKVSATSGATGDDLLDLENKAKDIGETTAKSASEAAEAMNYMAMAGWDTGQMMDGLDGIIQLSIASGEDLALTSDIVTDALTAFGMSAGDSSTFADLLAKTSSSANTNVAMLGESFKYVAPVMGAAGYTAEDTALALGLMANSGIKAGQAGTTLRGAITRMINPTEEAAGVMHDLGLELTNADGTMKPFKDVMDQLRTSMGDLTEEQQMNYASVLFGQEAMSGMLAIVNASEADYNKLSDATTNYAGTAEKMAETMQNGTAGALTSLSSKFEALQITIGEILQPVVEALIGVFSSLFDWFNNLSPGIQTAIVVVLGLIAAIGPLLLVGGMLLTFIATTTFAMSLLGITFMGTILPILAVIAAVIAFVGVLTYLWQTNETFRASITEIWNGIVTMFTTVFNFLKEIALQVFGELQAFWEENKEKVVGIFQAMWDVASVIWETAVNLIKGIVETVFNALKAFWERWGETITTWFQGAWDNIKIIFETVLDIILGVWEFFAGLFTGDWQRAWDGVKSIFSSLWDGICALFENTVDTVLSVGSDLFEGLLEGIENFVNWGSEKFEEFCEFVSNLPEMITTGFTDMVTNVGNFLGDLVDDFFDLPNKIKNAFSNIKFPSFEIKMSSKTFFGKEISYPTGFGINWHAEGGIFTQPTILGNHGFGEAGKEAILPLNRLPKLLGLDKQDKDSKSVVNEQKVTLHIDTFNNNTDQDIEDIATELAYYLKKEQIILGG